MGSLPQYQLLLKSVKNLTVRILPCGTVRVTAPLRTPLEIIDNFLRHRQAWIEEKQRLVMGRPRFWESPQLESGAFFFLGKSWIFERRTGQKARPCVMIDGEKIVLMASGLLSAEEERKHLDKFFDTELLRFLTGLVEKWQSYLGVSAEKIQVRSMRTRWGTCCPQRRKLSFSRMLCHQHPWAVEGVVVHELVHLLEPSHGPRFKKLMTQFLPDWRQREKALKESGRCSPLG